jgi:hypothetical protein
VSRKARTWAAAAALLLLVAGSTLAFGQVTGTFAVFNAVNENPNNVLVGGWVPKPSGTGSSAATTSPYSTANLSWTHGASPPLTSQTLQYHDGGSGASPSCPAAGSASYTAFSTPSASSNSASVAGTDTADWWCFEINSVDGNWTTDYVTFPGVRIFVPVPTVTFANGTFGGYAYNGDTIAITFNQAPSNPGTVDVQVCSTGVIQIGSSTCGSGGSYGTITGLGIASNASFPNSGSSVSGSTLTITLGGGGFLTFSHVTDTSGTFSAGGSLTSTGGQHACTTCTVATGGSF